MADVEEKVEKCKKYLEADLEDSKVFIALIIIGLYKISCSFNPRLQFDDRLQEHSVQQLSENGYSPPSVFDPASINVVFIFQCLDALRSIMWEFGKMGIKYITHMIRSRK